MRISDWSSDVCSSDLSNGRMNLADVIASGEQAPVSVTRAVDNAPAAARPAPGEPVTPTTPAAPTADIHIGEVTLANGQLNYTDNFIKPNYTAHLPTLTRRIRAFGPTPGTPPPQPPAPAHPAAPRPPRPPGRSERVRHRTPPRP